MKPFLVLQLRPEDEAADNEFAAFLEKGGLKEREARRIRMERDGLRAVNLDDYSGIIVGGGPSSVSDKPHKKTAAQKQFEPQLYKLLAEITARDFPFLGACYGLGVLAAYLEGAVSKEKYHEDLSAVTINLMPEAMNDPLTADLPENFKAFVGHKEACQELPPGSVLLASSAGCPIQMIRYKNNIYATQFHPELDSQGLELRAIIYQYHGYFPPEDLNNIIDMARQETIEVPELILKRFISRYSSGG